MSRRGGIRREDSTQYEHSAWFGWYEVNPDQAPSTRA